MSNNREDQLTKQEKSLIAMGARCRTCADKLFETTMSQSIPKKVMLQACHLGLDAKVEAVKTVKEKISALFGDDKADSVSAQEKYSDKLASMVRIASFAAANSAPNVLSEVNKAKVYGATDDQIQICISLAKMVRAHAMEFSDQGISGKVSNGESKGEVVSCSTPQDPKSASLCPCI